MIELTEVKEGTLGQNTWFSDLFLAAARSQLTGGILVQTANGSAAGVFFRSGSPVHAAGSLFQNFFIGEILVEMKACARSDVDRAMTEQEELEDTPPLLGTMLIKRVGINPAAVKQAIERQNRARIASLFGLHEGRWQAAPGMNARIEEIGVPVAPWPLFFSCLENHACDEELKALSNTLLGRAVKLSGGRVNLPDIPLSAEQKKLAAYLEKPRKPDQLERALRTRKMVRGFLRGLSLLDRLLVLPANKAIPIPKATLINSSDLPGADQARAKAVAEFEARTARTKLPRAPTPTKLNPPPARNLPIVREIEALHARLDEIDHFELLGVSEDVDASNLRKQRARSVKRFHPDSLPHEITGDVAVKAREICARINEAYSVLSDPNKRREYIDLMANDRVHGNTRVAERMRDAKMRARMGHVHLHKREYPKAREHFRFAMQADPETAEYGALYAWVTFCDPACEQNRDPEEIVRLLQKGIEGDLRNANLYFYLGSVLKAQERFNEALAAFLTTQQIDPHHTEAQREIRSLQKRSDPPSNEPKGGLSRLFRR